MEAAGSGDEIEGVPVVAAVREALAGADSLEEGVRRVLAEIGESLGWLFGACWHVGGGVLCVRQTWCARAYRSTSFEADSRAHAFHPGEGLPGRVWATGRPVWVEDALVEKNFPRHAAAAREGLRAAVAFPVHFDGKVYGVLEFYTDWLRTPTGAPPRLRAAGRGDRALHGRARSRRRRGIAAPLREESSACTES